MARPYLAAAVLVFVAHTTYAWAQGASTVQDIARKPIKGATIQATNRDAYPPELTATTDDKGRFAIIGLRAGVWRISAAAPGYMVSDGSVPVRSGTVGAPLQFVRDPTPE